MAQVFKSPLAQAQSIVKKPNEVYKGYTIEHFPYSAYLNGEPLGDIDGYLIQSPRYIEGKNGERVYDAIQPTNEYGEHINFRSIDEAKKYVDDWLVTKKGKLRANPQGDLVYELLPEYLKKRG